MYRYVPGFVNVTVVRRRGAGANGHFRRTRRVDRFRAGTMARMDRRVADDPLVVDRIAVVQDEGDSAPARTLTASRSKWE